MLIKKARKPQPGKRIELLILLLHIYKPPAQQEVCCFYMFLVESNGPFFEFTASFAKFDTSFVEFIGPLIKFSSPFGEFARQLIKPGNLFAEFIFTFC
jgi:hypothetical protein